jgi:hypothetical protein
MTGWIPLGIYRLLCDAQNTFCSHRRVNLTSIPYGLCYFTERLRSLHISLGVFCLKKRLENQHFYVRLWWTFLCPDQFECTFRRCYYNYCVCLPQVSRETTICPMIHCVNISISTYCLEERNIFTAKILHQTLSIWLHVRSFLVRYWRRI